MTSATDWFLVSEPINRIELHEPYKAKTKKTRRHGWCAAVIHAHSPRSPYSTLELPVTLRTQLPSTSTPLIIDTRAMVDLGASCCFINQCFVTEQGLPVICKGHPMRLWTIDNSEIWSGLITEEVHLRVVLGDHTETLVFDVADIGDDNLILGVNWLCLHNLSID